MKQKQLESILSQLQKLKSFKMQLEQYNTPPSVAAKVLFLINSYDNLCNKTVIEFGVGSGILSIGSSVFGSFNIGIDIDKEALEICAANASFMNVNIDLIKANCTNISLKGDIAIMNPPFGTKVKGIDFLFLETAFASCPIVYSMHKTSTRKFVCRKAKIEGFEATVIAEILFDIPKIYKCHKQKNVTVKVDLLRFVKL